MNRPIEKILATDTTALNMFNVYLLRCIVSALFKVSVRAYYTILAAKSSLRDDLSKFTYSPACSLSKHAHTDSIS